MVLGFYGCCHWNCAYVEKANDNDHHSTNELDGKTPKMGEGKSEAGLSILRSADNVQNDKMNNDSHVQNELDAKRFASVSPVVYCCFG